MLVYPPGQALLRCELGGNNSRTLLVEHFKTYFVLLFVVDADAQVIEVHHLPQFAREEAQKLLGTAF
jgi:hypothetical protein